MPRKYTKVEQNTKEVFARKAAGETNREIAESLGLKKEQVKNLVNRQRKKERLMAHGYVPRPKGRPKKGCEDKETQHKNEVAKLKMQVELLQNFVYEAGRR